MEKLLAILPFPEPEGFTAGIQDKYPGLSVTWIHQAYGITNFDAADTIDEDIYQDATILTTLSAIPKPHQAPKLRFIQLLPAGVDHLLDEPIFQKEGVQVATTSGIHAPQIAEWVILQMLSFSHHSRYLQQRQDEGRWVSHAELKDAQGPVRDMTTTRVGILGYGSIGRQIASVCHSMGSEVFAFTASPRNTVESRADPGFCLRGTGDPEGLIPSRWFHGLDKISIHDFLCQDLDVLVVCLPLTDQSRNLIGEEELSVLAQHNQKQLASGTLLINVARGQIIDQEALITSLKKPTEESGLRGAALDVTDPEPLPKDSELWYLPNVVIHPHVSGLTTEHQRRYLSVLEENLSRLRKGRTLMNLVDKIRGY